MSKRSTWRLASVTAALAAASCIAITAQAEETLSTGDGLLTLTANMPEEVRVGEEFTYTVKITNASDNVTIHDIELKQLKAKGFSVETTSTGSKDAESRQSVESKQDKKGKRNSEMKIAMLKPGESKTVNVTASADEVGELRSCLAIVNYMPAICLTSQVVKPQLELTKVAPKQADRCDVIELEYSVKNAGSGDVGPFIVTDTLGDGLATIDGDETLKFEVDGLKAGDTRNFLARVYASKPGSFRSRAIAKAENSDLKSRSKETTTEVIAADLAVQVDGPNRLYGEQLATFTAHVTNTGNAAADDVRVNVFWPEACNLVDFSEPTMQSSNQSSGKSSDQSQDVPTMAKNAKKAKQGSADKNEGKNGDDVELAMSDKSFTIERLEAGQTAVFEYAVRTGDVDTLPTKVVARYLCSVDAADDQADAKSETESMAMARAEVVRLAAMQMVVLDDEDPVAKKSNVVYSIRVWNEGDADDSSVTLKAEVPKGLEFVSAKGPTEHSVDGSTITFKPIKTMRAGDRADYKVTVKCTGNGDVRFAAMLNSQSLNKEVTVEESTRLFDQAAK
ncbi:Large cysteine-rich periplasmic protein omcB precursor [Novipirellula galeiformis]|uniref:Large cysteine-rich periplasmic protein omcB n=1 Tax=Novipirellula galeiformis TaxID=2528004 RepID=A0A5C6CK93_9BACT|nr:DUF11 domain-containing protein [Novipirellula galeiformis]TWU24822.1 Large cysteine-rich periplasmic protein omcB precursor [Novipirellula galeiformis]